MATHNMTIWKDCIRAWYPNYEIKSYFIPPVVITRIPFDVVPMAGQDVFVPQCITKQTSSAQSSSPQVKRRRTKVQESDTRDDVALQRVLFCLRELASLQKEPMFVLSQLKFSSYLGEPCYEAAAKHFLRPENIAPKYKDGDFDILVIHRKYGILTGEIKSVLSNQRQIHLSQKDKDQTIAKRVRQAIEQLDKSEVVLREITKDLQPALIIRKVLVLPYVTRSDLYRVLLRDRQLYQDLVSCLHAIDIVQAVEWCLLADDMPTHENEMVNMEEFKTWWSKCFHGSTTMTSELYLDLLARFCGPATTVSIYCLTPPRIAVRTEGQGVSILGERMVSLVLTPEQVSLQTRAPAKVMLTGPPGVGKSVMLVLMALTWLRDGHDVQLVSVAVNSLANTYMLNQMIQMSLNNNPPKVSVMGSVHLHDFDCYYKQTDVDKAILELTAVQGPHIICDEFLILYSRDDRPLHRLVRTLCTNIPSIKFWAASVKSRNIPEELQTEVMTIPLRYPTAVLREVEKGVNMASPIVYNYATTALPSPGDGPRVIYLSHQGPLHKIRWPLECDKCGQSIAGILKLLGVGLMDLNLTGSSVGIQTTCPPLQYHDVFVLTDRLVEFKDDKEDGISGVHGVVRGLRDAGIPVHVLRNEHLRTDVPIMMKTEMVTVANCNVVHGLERKVVTYLPSVIPSYLDKFIFDNQFDACNRLGPMSRCTAQLVVINVPLSLLKS